VLLGALGVLVHLIDAWAQQNSNLVLGAIEFGLLALWIGVDINEIARGTLKAGPEKPATEKAMHLPQYQLMLVVYCVLLAGVALFGAKQDLVSQFSSPFLVWLVAAPAAAAAFLVEYRAEGEWQKT